jgi:hypothetical protein
MLKNVIVKPLSARVADWLIFNWKGWSRLTAAGVPLVGVGALVGEGGSAVEVGGTVRVAVGSGAAVLVGS